MERYRLLALASRLVPLPERREWIQRWWQDVSSLAILIDRGEIISTSGSVIRQECLRAFPDAFERRFQKRAIRRFVRAPAAVLYGAATLAIVTAIASGGFRVTRHLLSIARAECLPGASHGDSFGTLLTFAIPIVFAWVVGLVLVAMQRPSLQPLGWRNWSFLAGKVLAVMLLVPAVWIELAPVIRALRPNSELALVITGVVSRIVFIGGFAHTLGWCFLDQKHRCPVCLNQLSMPVTLGSWASIFDPVTMEFLCDAGHGSLNLPESQLAGAGRWIKLDHSWDGLFDLSAR
jgi:hypothetical protein